MTKRQQCHRHELHVLYGEWKAYDREAQQDATHDDEMDGNPDHPTTDNSMNTLRSSTTDIR